ncbi:MAG TPA: hypothetical protein VGR72_06025 [Candidatus Acidoferrales bacterium]|nr:hypothetical protein [Candidatus Acidoferrales bacterium]
MRKWLVVCVLVLLVLVSAVGFSNLTAAGTGMPMPPSPWMAAPTGMPMLPSPWMAAPTGMPMPPSPWKR